MCKRKKKVIPVIDFIFIHFLLSKKKKKNQPSKDNFITLKKKNTASGMRKKDNTFWIKESNRGDS